MRKIALFLILLILALLLILNFNTLKQSAIDGSIRISTPDKSAGKPDSSAVQVFAKNLNIPWAIGFLPDESMLVTQRPGTVLQIDKNGNAKEVAEISVKAVGEGGLLGLAVDPDFESNNFIYIYYTYSSNGFDTQNKVSRFTFKNGKLTGEKVLLENIPGSSNHDGGRIKFGPDRYLYITTGDAENPSRAQDKNSLYGKILRVTKDGKAAPGNPFNNPVYSYGHRNPQGLAWDSDGNLWSTEHGRSAPTGYDELNKIEVGKNYGWPEIQGDEKRTGMVTPIINSGDSTAWAPAGAVFINGSIYFGGLRGQALYEYNISEGKLTEHLKNVYGRIRDVVLGPNGEIFITTSNRDGRGDMQSDDDKIIKINPSKLSTF